VVTFSGWQEGFGLLVTIDHGNGYETYYGHLSKLLVSAGQSVSAGDVIALSGNTGLSTGPHLHFEVHYLSTSCGSPASPPVIVLAGGERLKGEVQISGAKNAALPAIIATLLTPEPVILHATFPISLMWTQP
jgi:murein DD-endopeptidase MepM/ murein hydrolase activator NlpD